MSFGANGNAELVKRTFDMCKKESLPTVASSMGHRQAYLAMHLGAEVGKRGKKCVRYFTSTIP